MQISLDFPASKQKSPAGGGKSPVASARSVLRRQRGPLRSRPPGRLVLAKTRLRRKEAIKKARLGKARRLLIVPFKTKLLLEYGGQYSLIALRRREIATITDNQMNTALPLRGVDYSVRIPWRLKPGYSLSAIARINSEVRIGNKMRECFSGAWRGVTDDVVKIAKSF